MIWVLVMLCDRVWGWLSFGMVSICVWGIVFCNLVKLLVKLFCWFIMNVVGCVMDWSCFNERLEDCGVCEVVVKVFLFCLRVFVYNLNCLVWLDWMLESFFVLRVWFMLLFFGCFLKIVFLMLSIVNWCIWFGWWWVKFRVVIFFIEKFVNLVFLSFKWFIRLVILLYVFFIL